MATVLVQPGGYRFEVKPGETIMEAARAAGYYWPTTCGGNGECTTCACDVLAGAEHLEPMGRSEAASLVEGRGRSALQSGLRLACQARVRGDIEVRKPGVLPP
jgi:2Fe-2S ferredoxin